MWPCLGRSAACIRTSATRAVLPSLSVKDCRASLPRSPQLMSPCHCALSTVCLFICARLAHGLKTPRTPSARSHLPQRLSILCPNTPNLKSTRPRCVNTSRSPLFRSSHSPTHRALLLTPTASCHPRLTLRHRAMHLTIHLSTPIPAGNPGQFLSAWLAAQPPTPCFSFAAWSSSAPPCRVVPCHLPLVRTHVPVSTFICMAL